MSPLPAGIISNLMVITILSLVCIVTLLLVSYSKSTNGLKTNLESCHSDRECCCGQYCLAHRKYSACQCKSDRWWNSDLPYCRKGLIKLKFKTCFFLH